MADSQLSSSSTQGRAPASVHPSVQSGLDRQDGPWLAGVLLLGVLALLALSLRARAVTADSGVPVDDAWIHFQFARNLARGDGFSFNPGEPTAGSTAPLWTVLLAAVFAAGGRFPVAAQLLSATAHLASLIATYALARTLTRRRWTAALAAGVAAANGRLAWAGLSALETPLFTALSLLGILSHLAARRHRRGRLRTAAILGLATLARPEGALLFVLSLADNLLSAWRATRARKGANPGASTRLVTLIRCVLPGLALFIALVLPYVVFSLHTSGHVLPNTFSAKARVSPLPSIATLSLAARYLILDNPPLLPFYLLGLLALRRRGRVLSAWSVGLPLAHAFLHTILYHHGRYLIPLIPVNAAIASVGLIEAGRLARLRGWRWTGSATGLRVVVTIGALAGTAWRLPTMADLYAHDVDNINTMHVSLGRWVDRETPQDAVLALNDIGAITYLSQRRVIDLAGLVTPEVVPILRGSGTTARLLAFLKERDVDYVIIFPTWFPGLAARDDVLEEIHRVTLERRTIAGGETMVVYRLRSSP